MKFLKRRIRITTLLKINELSVKRIKSKNKTDGKKLYDKTIRIKFYKYTGNFNFLRGTFLSSLKQ